MLISFNMLVCTVTDAFVLVDAYPVTVNTNNYQERYSN